MEKKPLNLKPSNKGKVEESSSRVFKPWKILVVDDEPEVHSVTKLILENVVFKNRKIELVNAYSGEEAGEILSTQVGFAVILLDVVMETENAGLEFVEFVRNEMNNKAVRIILRTGQPGQAPEKSVIVDYDINDYKAKSELTSEKLFTTVIAALRAYESIRSLEKTRIGLERILASTDQLFDVESLNNFAFGVLTQIGAFLGSSPDGILCLEEGAESKTFKLPNAACVDLHILAGSGAYASCLNCTGGDQCPHKEMIAMARRAIDEKKNIFENGYAVLYLDTKQDRASVALMHGVEHLEKEDLFLLDIFSKKISLALANTIHFNKMVTAEEAATIDFLTGLPNRRQLINLGETVLATCKRNDLPTAVAMVDVDFFKRVNDTYGHDAGDAVLKALGTFLGARVRESDIAARFGGEEFCLVASNISTEQAEVFFNKICQEVRDLEIVFNEKKIEISVSIGVSTKLKDLDEMISDADK
ncbi:MAG: diguanylate cyclase, partial [SAR324 cluster bacterium]|nr:diguanylate cyclase [SAR324 cluster bacterium]